MSLEMNLLLGASRRIKYYETNSIIFRQNFQNVNIFLSAAVANVDNSRYWIVFPAGTNNKFVIVQSPDGVPFSVVVRKVCICFLRYGYISTAICN